jgi:hypothetical protein
MSSQFLGGRANADSGLLRALRTDGRLCRRWSRTATSWRAVAVHEVAMPHSAMAIQQKQLRPKKFGAVLISLAIAQPSSSS